MSQSAETKTARSRPANHPHDWPEGAFPDAETLFRDGNSGAEIARILNRKYGTAFSRQAVLGKLNRAGVSAAVKKALPKPFKPKEEPKVLTFKPKVKADRGAPSGEFRDTHPLARLWLERAFGECAFPVGQVGVETYSCCNPTEENAKGEVETYCRGCRKVMYQPSVRAVKKAVS